MAEHKIKVVLIEDDPMVQQVNKAFIEKVSGYNVIGTAANGMEGIEKVEALKPDLVILDVFMPKKDGLETIYQLRKNRTKVDVIIISAANDKETIQTMLQNGALDYIIKPFKFERIQYALERFKDYLAHLNPKGGVSQKELDILFSGKQMRQNNQNSIPKGLNELTLKQIATFLQEQTESKSAEEVAEGVGMARVTARRYLEYLEKIGKIKLDMQYGGVGRPVNRYLMKS